MNVYAQMTEDQINQLATKYAETMINKGIVESNLINFLSLFEDAKKEIYTKQLTEQKINAFNNDRTYKTMSF